MTHRQWHCLEPAAQSRLQLANLREFLRRQVLPFHPHYRAQFAELGLTPDDFRTPADVARLPFSDKSAVAPTADDPDRPRQFVLQPTPDTVRASLSLGRKLALGWQRLRGGEERVRAILGREYRPVQVFFTTGRTALPTSFFLTRYDLDILEECGRRIAEVATVDPGSDRILSVFPYAPHLAFWQVQAVGIASGTFTLQTGGGRVMGTEGILRVLSKVRPSYVAGIPGYVYHLFRSALEDGLDLSFVRRVFLGGDRVAPGYREKLIDLLRRGGAQQVDALSVFGFTESRRCWSECPGGPATGFHTYPDLDLFEIVDPDTGEVLPDGESGELVYTPLDGRGSIVLRYRTGDIVEGGITRERCPACGRTVPRFASDLSRRSNHKDFELTKIKGALVNMNAIADILNGHAAVDEWQLVIRKRNNDPFECDELVLSLALVDGSSAERAVAEIEAAMKTGVEVVPTEVEVLGRGELLARTGMETQLKENRIVDLRERPVEVPSSSGAEKG